MRKAFLLLILLAFISCNNSSEKKVPVVGFLDFIEDPTVALAKKGFFDALADNGFSESKGTIEVEYVNAQGDIPTLGQACDLLISKNPALIATNVTLSTITAVKRTETVPLFMMVSPRPDIAGLADKSGKYPTNLFGTYETLDYLDTSVTLIKKLMPDVKKVGTIYNQAEPQSVDAFNKLKAGCERAGIQLEVFPVTNSSETQLVMQSLINKKIDVFFALPDNVIFASFETVIKSCNDAHIPVFTSEAGLVSRGAVASFGADFYQWGYQSGKQAAVLLSTKSTKGLQPEIVALRKYIYNPEQANKYGITVDSSVFKSYQSLSR